MPVLRTEYQQEAPVLSLIQRDLGGTVYLPLERSGVPVVPTSAAMSMADSAGTVVASGSCTVGTSYVSRAISSSSLSGLSLSLDYWITWTLTWTSPALVRTYRERIGVVRFAPACPVSHTGLTSGRPLLLRSLAGTGETTLDVWIDAGWERLQRWLARQSGSRAHLAMDSSELYDLAEASILAHYWEEMIALADPDGTLRGQYEIWSRRLTDLQQSTHLTYDADDDGAADEDRRAATGPVMSGAYGSQRWS